MNGAKSSLSFFNIVNNILDFNSKSPNTKVIEKIVQFKHLQLFNLLMKIEDKT